MSHTDAAELLEAAAYLRAQVNALPSVSIVAGDLAGQYTRASEAAERLARHLSEKYHARIGNRWDGARIRMLGVTATSINGLEELFCNWIRAAEEMAAKLRDKAMADLIAGTARKEMLRPCPLCGGKAGIQFGRSEQGENVRIGCLGRGCTLLSKGHCTAAAAIKAWNARPEVDRLRDEKEQLLGVLMTLAGCATTQHN